MTACPASRSLGIFLSIDHEASMLVMSEHRFWFEATGNRWLYYRMFETKSWTVFLPFSVLDSRGSSTRLITKPLELERSQRVVLGLSKIEHAIEAGDLEDFMDLSAKAAKLHRMRISESSRQADGII